MYERREVFVEGYGVPYQPDERVLKALYDLDEGRLRLRWSAQLRKWCIERELSPAETPSEYIPKQWIVKGGRAFENDLYIRKRDGYCLIGTLDPYPYLGLWMIENLRQADIRRLGGAQKVAELLEGQEAARKYLLSSEYSREASEKLEEYWDRYFNPARQEEVLVI